MLGLLPCELWNYGPSDTVRGLRATFASRSADAPRSLDIFGLGPCLPVGSARAAIVLALRALGLPAGARVGVPLYCCPVVFKAIEFAGCRVRFVDVDQHTYSLSASDLASKSSEVDAVLAVHMFGNVCDMARVREAAAGKPIIEDCAQALGSRLDGRPAGSFGDIAVFSFNSGKYVSAGGGGALFSRDAGLEDQLSRMVAALPARSRTEECIHVTKTWLRSSLRTRPLWGLMGLRVWECYGALVSHASQSPVALASMYESDRATTVRRLPLVEGWIEEQRSHAGIYWRNLRVDVGMLCLESRRAFYNRLQFPVLAPTSEQCDRLVERLRKDGISAARPYKDIAAVAAAHYGYRGDCPEAEGIASRVLVLPCNHSLKSPDIERVVECMNRAWGEIRSSVPRARESSVCPVDAAANETSHPELQNR